MDVYEVTDVYPGEGQKAESGVKENIILEALDIAGRVLYLTVVQVEYLDRGCGGVKQINISVQPKNWDETDIAILRNQHLLRLKVTL